MSEAAIELAGVVRLYGGTRALDGLDLRVPAGSVFGLLGNNGAGKTTSIRIMMGLIPAHAGRVSVLGLDPQRQRPEVLRAVGFVAENDDPYEWMRLAQLFRVGRAAFPAWDDRLCRELCDLFDLDPKKKVAELSKGMLAKTKLVFAMSHVPRCLVLDEPTSGLDPGSQRELLQIIRRLSRERGITTLFSSHNLGDVADIATHIAIIHRGRVVFDEAMAAIRDHYGIARRTTAEPEWSADLRRQAIAEDAFDGAATLLVRDRTTLNGAGPVEPAGLSDLFHLVTAGRRIGDASSTGEHR